MRVDPITAILGIAMLLGGLVLSLVGVQDSYEVVVLAATRAVFALLAAILASLAAMRFMPRTRVGRRLVLDTGFAARAAGYASAPASHAKSHMPSRKRPIPPARPPSIVPMNAGLGAGQ